MLRQAARPTGVLTEGYPSSSNCNGRLKRGMLHILNSHFLAAPCSFASESSGLRDQTNVKAAFIHTKRDTDFDQFATEAKIKGVCKLRV